MNMIDTFLAMDVGFGVEPEILVFKTTSNYISFRVSKKFKGEKYYQQFDVTHPAINKNYNQDFEKELNKAIEYLQYSINQVNNKDK